MRQVYPPVELDTTPTEVWEDRKGAWWCEVEGAIYRAGSHVSRYYQWFTTWAEVEEESGPLWKVPEPLEAA